MIEKKHNYVYKITNLLNNKIYIGVHSTDNINDGYMGSGTVITNAIKKYGVENSKEKISKAKSGEKHHMFGKHHSEATKRKMSESKIGEKNPFFGKKHSEETRKKFRARKGSNLGKHFSEEHRKKMSEARRGKPWTAARRAAYERIKKGTQK